MDDFVDLVVKKAGLPAVTAKTIITLAVNYFKNVLPAPASAQNDRSLGIAGPVQAA